MVIIKPTTLQYLISLPKLSDNSKGAKPCSPSLQVKSAQKMARAPKESQQTYVVDVGLVPAPPSIRLRSAPTA